MRITLPVYVRVLRPDIEPLPPFVVSRCGLIDYYVQHAEDQLEASGRANLLWADYRAWRIALAPLRRPYTFKRYLRNLIDMGDPAGLSAVLHDVALDHDFPNSRHIDRIIDYLTENNATNAAIDEIEELHIRYQMED